MKLGHLNDLVSRIILSTRHAGQAPTTSKHIQVKIPSHQKRSLFRSLIHFRIPICHFASHVQYSTLLTTSFALRSVDLVQKPSLLLTHHITSKPNQSLNRSQLSQLR